MATVPARQVNQALDAGAQIFNAVVDKFSSTLGGSVEEVSSYLKSQGVKTYADITPTIESGFKHAQSVAKKAKLSEINAMPPEDREKLTGKAKAMYESNKKWFKNQDLYKKIQDKGLF
jgi:hypothetical protein